MRLRDLFRRWPRPDDAEAVRRMTAREWATIHERAATYLPTYTDKPGSEDRAQRRAEWLAAQPMWDFRESVLELGCGAGRNLAAIQRRWPAIEVGGIDINEAALWEAKRILPGGQWMRANLYEVADADLPARPDVILTSGCLGHLEATAVRTLLRWALRQSEVVVLLEQPGHGEVLKGPKAWGAAKSTGSYVLWAWPFSDWLVDAGAKRVEITPLPEDLCAPAATELLVARR